MTGKTLTVNEGIKIQNEQLKGWKKVLIPECYESLEEYAKRNNDKAKTGYDICRGSNLSVYVNNYILGHKM